MTEIFGQNRPWIIAGPCSAESEEQLFGTASELRELGVRVLRAGLWKPRTRPGCFEGVGEAGLPWLGRVRRELGMKVCTEVAGAAHVEACLKAGVDMVWVGSRTTTNPFLMQEVADALSGTGMPVFVKNPINADLYLWVGAVERLQKSGTERIGLIHRGFSSYERIRYRNLPQWQLAAEMRRLNPGLPMLCDPSHMGGAAYLVPEISHRAMDLGFDGLMVEVHCNPSCALCDASQQLLPSEFGALVSNLRRRDPDSKDEAFASDVAELRSRIDSLDESMLELLSRRMEVSRSIGKLKKDRDVAVLQLSRWDSVLSRARHHGAEYGLDPEFVSSLFNIIHAASIAEQNKVFEDDSQD